MTTGPVLPAQGSARTDLAAAGALLGAQAVRALVMARLEDGLIRLAVPGGPPVSVRAPADIEPGMIVEVAAEADPSLPGKPPQWVVRGQAPPLPQAAAPATAAATTAATASPPAPAASPPATPQAARAQVTAAAGQAAAQRQGGLGPLMADLAQVVGAPDTPPPVKAAAARVLAIRQPIDRVPSGGDVRRAVSRSGLFLETRLAAQPPAGVDPAAPLGDMKAALLAVRQVLKAWQAAAVAPPPEETASPPPPAPAQGPDPAASARPPAAAPPAAEAADQQRPPVAASPPATPASAAPATLAAPAPPIRGPALALAALEILSAAAADPAPDAASPPAATATASPPDSAGPAPPYRGGPVTAQPPAAPTLAVTAEPAVVVQRLLQETGGALARQELLQLASLPEAATDARAAETPRAEQGQRWMFEIPFAAPQGTAVAQFEISRDGRRKPSANSPGGEAAEPVWRTRFSIDLEPIGPVHAHLALSGERVQVSLWAEREAGLARLRDSAPLLTQALNRAVAGREGAAEVAVHAGAPHRPLAAAGRFVDVAS
jgi:hypothetical protein